jgi:RNA polymerase sigma factor (sigma-70 family)
MLSTFLSGDLSSVSTAALVERCLRNDSRAWEALVQRYARLVHSVAGRHGLTSDEVDDVGQEVFLALAQNLHAIDDPERLPAWLATTARRLSWRVLQRRRAEIPLESDADDDAPRPTPELVSPLPTPGELVSGWHRQAALADAMRKLAPRCRDLLILVFLDTAEPSYDEIAARLGMPKGSIGPTRNRCLEQLRALLAGMGFDAER